VGDAVNLEKHVGASREGGTEYQRMALYVARAQLKSENEEDRASTSPGKGKRGLNRGGGS